MKSLGGILCVNTEFDFGSSDMPGIASLSWYDHRLSSTNLQDAENSNSKSRTDKALTAHHAAPAICGKAR